MIREQLGRLHDTPFELADIKLKLDPQLMIPKSILNELTTPGAGRSAAQA
jgi:hypothetical protein